MTQMFTCPHWSADANPARSQCAIGLGGGRPAITYCLRCPHATRMPRPVPAEPLAAPVAPSPSSPPAKAVAPTQWPLVARVIASRAVAGEIGVGDTLARLLGVAGGKVFKRWYQKITGVPCGCKNRQERLNTLFPYEPRGALPE